MKIFAEYWIAKLMTLLNISKFKRLLDFSLQKNYNANRKEVLFMRKMLGIMLTVCLALSCIGTMPALAANLSEGNYEYIVVDGKAIILD